MVAVKYHRQTFKVTIGGVRVRFIVDHKEPLDGDKLPALSLVADSDQVASFSDFELVTDTSATDAGATVTVVRAEPLQ